jgi:hypothetical protein
LYQIGGPIYGVGLSEAEARADAAQWLSTEATADGEYVSAEAQAAAAKSWPRDRAEINQGDLVISECTERLYAEVAHNGACPYDDTGDILDLSPQLLGL